jgi:hypothetical protein
VDRSWMGPTAGAVRQMIFLRLVRQLVSYVKLRSRDSGAKEHLTDLLELDRVAHVLFVRFKLPCQSRIAPAREPGSGFRQ